MHRVNARRRSVRGGIAGKLILLLLLGGIVYGVLHVIKNYPWLYSYVTEQSRPRSTPELGGPTHIMFLFVDHFEPHSQADMDRWMKHYPAMAAKFVDADGRHPQHTWFWYFGHSDEAEQFRFLQQLGDLAFQRLGEVELHLHHYGDNEQTFLEKIGRMISLSQSTGAMITGNSQPRTAFGFIHGLWALDNSREGACGVNNELILLKRLNCYADFTHPSWGPMHPSIINQLYYAADDPERPKSYDRGEKMEVGGAASGDLLIFEGPSVVHWEGIKPRYDHGDITQKDWPTPERIAKWIETGIHVDGRPEWVFVKVYTHGAVEGDADAVLGRGVHQMHAYLTGLYNDGQRYVLHYVTAREAYNIAKAAEAGHRGNPDLYRNFLIPPYANRLITASVPFEFQGFDDVNLRVKFLSPAGEKVKVRLRARDISLPESVQVHSSEILSDGTHMELTPPEDGVVNFFVRKIREYEPVKKSPWIHDGSGF